MHVLDTISELNNHLTPYRAAGKKIGLVPTMGYLHAGHASLIEAARAANDLVVVSVFVNPAQFAPSEDYEAYPRDLERDIRVAGEAGADLIFAPETGDIYPGGFATYVVVEGPETDGMCADSRPGHFLGVTTVVAKLLNIIRPDRAYFGQKDAQQLAVIRRMVKDLNIPVEIISCPIIRESDGLAISSRNVYMSTEERAAAVILQKALRTAEEAIHQGETSSDTIIEVIKRAFTDESLVALEYAEIRSMAGFSRSDVIKGETLIAVAATIGKTRLIDNIVVDTK